MTGYLPYLIEKHGYSEQSVICWIENQLKRYSNVFVTSNTDEFNIIVVEREVLLMFMVRNLHKYWVFLLVLMGWILIKE